MARAFPNPSQARGVAVADIGAVTSTAPAALTGAAAAGGTPTKTEYDKTVADVVAMRTTIAALVVDVAALRTKLLALQDSLQGGGVIQP